MEDQDSTPTKYHWMWSVLAYSSAAALFLVYANLEGSRSAHDGDFKLTTIERLHPAITNRIGWLAFGACMILLAISAVSFKTRWLRRPAIGLAIGLIFYPFCVLLHTVKNLPTWTIHGQVATDDGTTFVFCDCSFLQGQTMALARVSHQDNWTTTYRVLIDNNGDWPESWASVIRPDGSTDEYGQLYLKNGFLIGVRYENKCYLAYDLKNYKAYGHSDIETLSPFVCLAPGDIPSQADVQRTCDCIIEHALFCNSTSDIRHAQAFLNGEPVPGCPSTRELRSALSGRPTAVASVAKSLLSCYDDAFGKLRTRDATSPASPP